MPNFNKVIIAGYLTRDPQIKYTPNQTAVCECGIAETEKYKSGEHTCFLDFTIFGKQAESFNKYTSKGSAVLLEGKLKLDSWTANDGTKRNKIKMLVDNFQFLSSGKKQETQETETQPETEDVPF